MLEYLVEHSNSVCRVARQSPPYLCTLFWLVACIFSCECSSLFLLHSQSGRLEQWPARKAHNLEVVGSSPASATSAVNCTVLAYPRNSLMAAEPGQQSGQNCNRTISCRLVKYVCDAAAKQWQGKPVIATNATESVQRASTAKKSSLFTKQTTGNEHETGALIAVLDSI